MEARLRAFLNFLTPRRVKEGEPFTHVSKPGPWQDWYPGRYFIEVEDREEFTNLYQNLVRHKVPMTLAEYPEKYGPLRVDIDFKASIEAGEQRQYTRKNLANLVGIYQDEIRKLIDPDTYEDNMLWCVILEKKAPRVEEEGIVKDGFHIHFQHFFCDATIQDVHLRSRVSKRMTNEGVWRGCNFITQLDKIIDTGIAKKPWMLYGSMNYKGELSTPYEYSRKERLGVIFNHNLKSISLSKLFEDEMIGRSRKPEYYLPTFLAIRGCREATNLQESVIQAAKEYNKRRKPQVFRTKKDADVLKDLKFIEEHEIMGLLDKERADDYHDWIRTGWALFNIGQGHIKALDMWIDFSKKSPKFTDGSCEDEWARMKLGTLGLGTLMWWAKHDSPKRYKKNMIFGLRTLMRDCLREPKPKEWDVAKVVCEKYRNRFKCAIVNRKTIWHEFSNHRWREIHGEVPLRVALPEDIADEFRELLVDLSSEYRTSGSDKSAELVKRCLALISELKTDSFQTRVVKQCKLKMYDGDFLEKLDEDKELLGCENGVLDLRQGVFRPGEPDDYISFSTGLIYQEYPKGGLEEKDLNEYLMKTFPNPKLRAYFLDFMCSCMRGGNVHKRFLVKTGNGDNGKSVTVEFLEMVFGMYCGKFPRELLVRGRGNSSGQARPELARVRGKRIMFCQEIGNDIDELNVGQLKELTGNDSFYTRTLFEKGTEIKPMFTLILQCLSSGTPINLPNGISMPIESLASNTQILSWDEELGGLILANQERFLVQGTKKCVTLVLQDGREITCTPDHRFLESGGKWIEAQNIILGETSLLLGAHQPCYDLSREDTEFTIGEWKLTTLTGKLKAMAACRLLGYGLADGSMNIQLYMGHQLDARQVVNDIELLTGKRPKIGRCNNCLHIHIPRELTHIFNTLCPAQPGGRVNNPMSLPKFIFDDDCPEFLIREFIAGLFGGDGIVPRVQKNSNCNTYGFTPLGLVASKINKHIPSLVDALGSLSNLLKNRFGITSSVSKPNEYEEGKSRVHLLIHRNHSTRVFIENIGVRYCCHKAYRLTAVLSYARYRDSIIEQNDDITLRTIDLIEKYRRQNPKPQIGQFNKNGELMRAHKSTQKAQHATNIDHSLISSACKRNGTSGGFTWRFIQSTPTTESESGCKTIKEAHEKAIKEQGFIFSKADLVTYTQVRRRILRSKPPEKSQVNNLQQYLETTGLCKFCNTGRKVNYSVDADSGVLPTYNMLVIGRKEAGERQVYDLTVGKHHNFVANGVISHNCNDPPKIPGDDRATWNRIRVLDYESNFIKPEDLNKDSEHIVPETLEEQMKIKRFIADTCFDQKLPFLAPVLLWKLFQRYTSVYKDRGLYEPPEVTCSTNRYQTNNDIFRQFIKERIRKVKDKSEAVKSSISVAAMYEEFKDWHKANYPSYQRKICGRSQMRDKLIPRLGGVIKNPKEKLHGFRDSKWWGHKIYIEKEDEEEGPSDQGERRKLTRLLANQE